MRRHYTLAGVVAMLAVWVFGFSCSANAQSPEAEQPGSIEFSPISGDPERPRRHERVRNAATLGAEDAKAVYDELRADMARRYAPSGDASAAAYQTWQQYNAAPYRSATHGQRFVNNFANPAAEAYGRYEEAGRLPVGSVIAKDSFTVTTGGAVAPGPLFLMEKMPDGFNRASGNWRYTLISPDGELQGTTKGAGSARVEYCVPCHLARERFDHLYFLPRQYRIAR